MPITDFVPSTNDKKHLVVADYIRNFTLGDMEEEMLFCPEETRDGYTFPTGKYSEIVFAKEMCSSQITNDANGFAIGYDGDFYNLSNYVDENGVLQNNRSALICGRDGEWSLNFAYSCLRADKCQSPEDTYIENTTRHWTAYLTRTFPVRSIIKTEEGDFSIICVATYNTGTKKWNAEWKVYE
jgi:hypothetical protein